MSDDESIDKLKIDRQQWRLSAEVVGAQTEDFTATITGVSRCDCSIRVFQNASIEIIA